MRNRLLIISLFLLLSAGNLSAMTVDVTFDNGGPIDTALSTLVETAVLTELSKYDDMPDLTRGFGNANTYASHAATLRGYQGYDLFAISVGSMVSVQSPDDDPKFYEKLQDKLDDGDVYAGVGGNPAVVQAGLNLGFLVEDLYMSFKFGKFDYEIDKSKYKIDYQSNLFGILLNYQIFKQKAILARTLLWRGISLESGFIYSNNKVSFYKELDELAPITSGTYTAIVDPSIDLVLDTKTVVVPAELYTSIRLLYCLNIGVGGGFDYVPYGKTNFKLESAGTIKVTDSAIPGFEAKGDAKIKASTDDVEPDKFRAKLMANLGISAGPVFIDVPASYYFTDNGYSIGVSAGMAW